MNRKKKVIIIGVAVLAVLIISGMIWYRSRARTDRAEDIPAYSSEESGSAENLSESETQSEEPPVQTEAPSYEIDWSAVDDAPESDFEITEEEDGVYIQKYLGGGGEVKIPETIGGMNVIGIGTKAFRDTAVTAVNIPGSVYYIDIMAFAGCVNLESVYISDGVVSIGGSAFYNCVSLADIRIPESVTGFGMDAFSDTLWIVYKRQENPLVIVNNVLIDGRACTGDVMIPEGTTYIAARAFATCEGVESITIPETVTIIDHLAFSNCPSLKSVKIPDTVLGMGISMFWNCPELREVTIPDHITQFSKDTFGNCEKVVVTWRGNTYTYDNIEELYTQAMEEVGN